ncbi:MAG: hypothetical protein EPN97_07325, partial [Alphaproteobacteria bacterium]
MADIVITVTAVLPGSNAVTENGTAAAAVTAGQVLYKSSTTGQWGLADADGATAEIRQGTGIALNGAAAGQ